MKRKPAILVVEDTPALARLYQEYLRLDEYDVTHVDTGKAAIEALDRIKPQAMMLDLKLPDMYGLDILKHVAESGLPTAVVVVTANGSINIAVDAMRAGAFDFLVKPFNADRLRVTLRNALERQRLTKIVETYQQQIARESFEGFIGSSLEMQGVYRIIESASPSKATVFITGESGSGKEVCAQAIHNTGPRSDKPFIAINCGAIPGDLMESEIFGHVKGAFTGASADREGAAAMADGGTLFLDEICEMDLALQTKLLRFVQTGIVQKVGSDKPQKVDVRLICATNKDPLKEVEASRFREDLYYRLHVVPISLPPLRARNGDIVAIAEHFLTSFAAEEGKAFQSFTPEALNVVTSYDWPGNVRQLQNVIRNIVVLHDGEAVAPEMLPPPLDAPSDAGAAAPAPNPVRHLHTAQAPTETGSDKVPVADSIRPLWQVERDTIEAAIDACDGNIPKAAALLEISPSTIYRKRLSWDEEDTLPRVPQEVAGA